MDPDQGVAVASLRTERQVELEGAAGGALGDQAPALREPSGDERVEFPLKTVGESIGRIAEDQVEAPPRPLQVAQRVRAHDLAPAVEVELMDVAAREGRSPVDQRGVSGAARDGLDPERPGAAEEVQDRGAAHVTENREER